MAGGLQRLRLLACIRTLALVAAMPKENCSTQSTSTTSSTTSASCSKTSSSRAADYSHDSPSPSYGVPPSYATSGNVDDYSTRATPNGYSTPAPPPYYPGECPEKTVTLIRDEGTTITVTTVRPYDGTSCVVTEMASGSCPSTTLELTETAPAETNTFTETPPAVTITDVVVTPPAVTSTITLSGPTLKRRSAATCSDQSTTTVTISGYGGQYTSTTTSYFEQQCITITQPFECASPTATSLTTITPDPSTTTTTLAASTTSLTITLAPSTLTATLIPTTTFSVLRATGIVPLDSSPSELALANSNNMYASLRLMPGASDGSYALTFDNPVTSPDTAAQVRLDGTNFFASGNGAEDYIANTFYTDRSGYFYLSPSADPADATFGYPAIRCSVDDDGTGSASGVLRCNNGRVPDRFKDQFTLCEGDDYAGENVNGNLFLTRDALAQGCPRVEILVERVVLFEVVAPTQ